MSIADGANYAPESEGRAVVQPGEFRFAAAFLDHGHIAGQCNGLIEAGGTLTHVFDPDPKRLANFVERFPGVAVSDSFDALLDDNSLQLIASAAVPDQRAGIGARVLKAGKDYFTDKSPFTSLDQLMDIAEVVEETGQRYFVYYAERVHNEAAWHAGELIADGRIGEVLHVVNLAPHRLAASSRPDWFFDKARYGGIITDIGSHQVEQFLTYASCSHAAVNFASVRNCSHPEYPGLEDFGEFSLTGVRDSSSGAGPSFYSRIDWYTPDGMPVWGDGRAFITGTEGTLEVRKYLDLGRKVPASLILLADGNGVEEIDCQGRIGYPFFGQLILDSLNRTEHAMTQEHIFRAAELSMLAQYEADQQRAELINEHS